MTGLEETVNFVFRESQRWKHPRFDGSKLNWVPEGPVIK